MILMTQTTIGMDSRHRQSVEVYFILMYAPVINLSYSIEDAKQKTEYDRMMKLAEEKKLHTRRQISSLRRTFAKLHKRNSSLLPHLQLGPESFVMDPDMEKNLKEQAEEKVVLVHKEMGWESEKHRIGLYKLQAK